MIKDWVVISSGNYRYLESSRSDYAERLDGRLFETEMAAHDWAFEHAAKHQRALIILKVINIVEVTTSVRLKGLEDLG